MPFWSRVRLWYLVPALQFGALLCLSFVVFGFRLGAEGLSYTEGHRAIPAWEMIESGDFLTPRMFGTAYLRKPPGLSWAIAASSTVFGQTEFAARFVGALSGTAMVLATWWFGTRWFGSPCGLVAGLVQIATPQFWRFARSAEIEGLNNAVTQIAVFLTIDALIQLPGRSRRRIALITSLLCLSLVGLALVKGPAGVPCVLAAVAAAILVQQNWRVALSRRLVFAFAGAMFLNFVVFLSIAYRLEVSRETPVVQRVFGFDWALEHLLEMFLLAPRAMLAGLPASLLLIAPWFRPRELAGLRQAKCQGSPESDRSHLVARAIAWTSLISLGVYASIGLTNPRYAMPAVTFLPVLAGYVAPDWARNISKCRGFLWWRRAAISPIPWTIAAIAMWLGLVLFIEPQCGMTSGRRIASEVADTLPDGALVWADSLIEARPETLAYIRRMAADRGRRVEMAWKKQEILLSQLPPEGSYLALRSDDGEVERYRQAGLLDELQPVFEGKVHRYSFIVYRVANAGGRSSIASTNSTLDSNTKRPSPP